MPESEGNQLLEDAQQSDFRASGVNRLDADVLGVASVTDAIVLEGINDTANQASAAAVESGLSQVVARLHARGLRVLIGTLLPATTGLLSLGSLIPGIYVDSSGDGVRAAVNGWIRSGGSGADRVGDFDAAVRNPTTPNELSPGLDSGDTSIRMTPVTRRWPTPSTWPVCEARSARPRCRRGRESPRGWA